MTWRAAGQGLIRSLLTSYLALGVTLYIVPGRQSSGPLAVLGLVIAVAVVGVLLRPLLVGFAVVLGSFGLLLVGVLSQALILDVAILLTPDVAIRSQPEVLLVSLVAAVVAAVVNWLLDAGSDEVFLSQLLGRAARVGRQQRRLNGAAADSPPGLLVIQLDGVSVKLVRQAITAGDVPTLSRLLQSGSHILRGWHTGLPATTPAAQAVLLHGDEIEVPSFRWFEKETRRLMVANYPHDAAEIQRRISDGHGLLSDGGVSVSTLFSGDATTPLLTMSDARLPPRNTRGLASFAATGGGLARVLIVWVGQVFTELYQGHRQRRRHVRPRVRRGPTFAFERAMTSALLRDLNVAIVAEQIARGAPVIFVDFVDYDEIAHHAGPSRSESMRTLDVLDRLIRFFTDVIQETARDYEVVILSDHGQAQGATFAQLCGQTLNEVVQNLTTGARRPAAKRSAAHAAHDDIKATIGGPAAQPAAESPPARPPTVIVAAAGNLAHLYLADQPGRCTREQVDQRHPHLIAGLVEHPQIGVVVLRSAEAHEPVAIGADGWRVLTASGAVGGAGSDPVAGFGPLAASDLWALDARRHVGDLIVVGRFDPKTSEVAAFEDLVGSHGGLGGDQTDALLIHPAGWPVPNQSNLCGLDVHELLRARVGIGGAGRHSSCPQAAAS